MLIEFSVENYLCFKDRVTLSMVASAGNEHEENLITIPGRKEKLLKSCVIYGHNASGKSNLLKAMEFMRNLIMTSSKETQVKEKINVEPFLLSTATRNEPSTFEIVFLCDETQYRYGFSIDREKVHSEWLYHVPGKRESRLFERKEKEFQFSSKFAEGKRVEEMTRTNALLLSVAAQFNGEISGRIMEWLDNFYPIQSLSTSNQNSINLMSNSIYSHKILDLMKTADLNIEHISAINVGTIATRGSVKIQIPTLDLSVPSTSFKAKVETYISELNTDKLEKVKEEKIFEAFFHHNVYDENGSLIGNEEFDEEAESEGTKKLFALSGPLISTILEGKILAIDEIDSSLHILILHRILKMFNSESNKNAQLIFTCHNPMLISNYFDIFRRDQVWFLEKDDEGASDLYSLHDFKSRKKASFDIKYLLGNYGAIPKPGDFTDLLQ